MDNGGEKAIENLYPPGIGLSYTDVCGCYQCYCSTFFVLHVENSILVKEKRVARDTWCDDSVTSTVLARLSSSILVYIMRVLY